MKMMTNPKVGDRGICRWGSPHTNLSGVYPWGKTATVIEVEVGANYVRVRFDDPEVQRACERACGHLGFRWARGYWEATKGGGLLLPADKVAKFQTRDGRPASVIRHVGGERPFQAYIEFSGRRLDLSFDQFGRFYPDVDSPFDLVCK